jgi:hypothetical protein
VVCLAVPAPVDFGGLLHGKDGETTSSDNSTSPREGGTSEVHRPQLASERSSAHPQAGHNRSPPAPTERITVTN